MWVQLFAEYENIEKLDRRVLAALVDRILIYEDKRVEVVFKYRDEIAHAMAVVETYRDAELPKAI